MDFRQRRQVQPLQQSLTGADLTRAADQTLRSAPRLRDQRKARHAGIFEAIHRLDSQVDQAAREQLAGWVRDQYDVEYGDIPMGFVAPCFLGPPYVDHVLDLIYSIV